jgi:hypothetical protein
MFLARQYDVTCMSGVCKKFHEWIKGSMEERKGSLSQWIKEGTMRQSLLYAFICSASEQSMFVFRNSLSGFGSDIQHVCRTAICLGELRLLIITLIRHAASFDQAGKRVCIHNLYIVTQRSLNA